MAQELLVLGPETPALRQVVPVLRRVAFQVHRLARADQAVELLQGTRFDLILVRYPLEGLSLDELIATVRAKNSPCLDSGLLVMAAPENLEEVAHHLRRGVNRIVDVDVTCDRLLDAIADLVGVPPRRRLRAVVQFELWVAQGAQRLFTVTENLSCTGMLVRGGQEFPVGTCLQFKLMLPGQMPPIAGLVRVARHTDRTREHLDGFGGKILSFAEDGQHRLQVLLEEAPASS